MVYIDLSAPLTTEPQRTRARYTRGKRVIQEAEQEAAAEVTNANHLQQLMQQMTQGSQVEGATVDHNYGLGLEDL